MMAVLLNVFKEGDIVEVITLAGFSFLAQVKEDTGDYLVLDNPLVINLVPNPITKRVEVVTAPLTENQPLLQNVRLKKDLALAVVRVRPELEKIYTQATLQLTTKLNNLEARNFKSQKE